MVGSDDDEVAVPDQHLGLVGETGQADRGEIWAGIAHQILDVDEVQGPGVGGRGCKLIEV